MKPMILERQIYNEILGCVEEGLTSFYINKNLLLRGLKVESSGFLTGSLYDQSSGFTRCNFMHDVLIICKSNKPA